MNIFGVSCKTKQFLWNELRKTLTSAKSFWFKCIDWIKDCQQINSAKRIVPGIFLRRPEVAGNVKWCGCYKSWMKIFRSVLIRPTDSTYVERRCREDEELSNARCNKWRRNEWPIAYYDFHLLQKVEIFCNFKTFVHLH